MFGSLYDLVNMFSFYQYVQILATILFLVFVIAPILRWIGRAIKSVCKPIQFPY